MKGKVFKIALLVMMLLVTGGCDIVTIDKDRAKYDAGYTAGYAAGFAAGVAQYEKLKELGKSE